MHYKFEQIQYLNKINIRTNFKFKHIRNLNIFKSDFFQIWIFFQEKVKNKVKEKQKRKKKWRKKKKEKKGGATNWAGPKTRRLKRTAYGRGARCDLLLPLKAANRDCRNILCYGWALDHGPILLWGPRVWNDQRPKPKTKRETAQGRTGAAIYRFETMQCARITY